MQWPTFCKRRRPGRGGDYAAAAAKVADELYGYGHTNVLFKPTKAAAQFRPSADAVSYFVGHNPVENGHAMLALPSMVVREGQMIPQFSEQRIALAKRRAQRHVGSFPLAIGAVPSLRMRQILFGEHHSGAICGEPAPDWDHTWRCAVKREPPCDILLRRFGWPRHGSDFELSKMLMDGLEKVSARC